MRKTCLLLLIFFAALVISACATVYESDNFASYQARHRSVAILPPNVSINAQAFKAGTPVASIENQQREESQLFMRQLYGQLLARSQKQAFTVEFQDIDDTMALLTKASIDDAKLKSMTRSELASVLGVDAIMSLRVYRDVPMTSGEAIFSLLVAGASSTNEVQVNLSIHDGETGRMAWNFDHLIGGGLTSSAEGMARSLMKAISKKFPYNTKKKA
jgi:nicotinic acid mononucleotide adenylyltransferase